ncbi:MAG TPA: hypothetical protein ENJ82_05250, partial [Bacteroidetes bacterium]|nr:hypothetical protein [Bacteroidota bacterium]
MKNRFSILAFFFCAIFSTLPAQETWVSDPAPTYFKGVVTYKVSYSGKLSYAQKRWLPDSMVIQANAPYIRIQFFGGMSDTLMQDVLWNSLDKNYLLIDHAHKYAYYPEVPSVMPTPKRSQIKGN